MLGFERPTLDDKSTATRFPRRSALDQRPAVGEHRAHVAAEAVLLVGIALDALLKDEGRSVLFRALSESSTLLRGVDGGEADLMLGLGVVSLSETPTTRPSTRRV